MWYLYYYPYHCFLQPIKVKHRHPQGCYYLRTVSKDKNIPHVHVYTYHHSLFTFQDSELNELRATIEALKRQSGLSIPEQPYSNGGNSGRRHTTPGMLGKDLSSHHSQGGRVFHTLPMPAGNSANLLFIF